MSSSDVIGGSNPSVNQAGAPPIAPTTATLVAGIDPGTGFVTPIATDSAGNLNTSQGTISGTITQAVLSIGTSPVRLTVSGAVPNPGRKQLMFQPDINSAADFWLGSSGVAIGVGIQVFPGQNYIITDDASDYFLISSIAAQAVYVSEVV